LISGLFGIVKGERLVDVLAVHWVIEIERPTDVLVGALRDLLGGSCAVREPELFLDAPETLGLVLDAGR